MNMTKPMSTSSISSLASSIFTLRNAKLFSATPISTALRSTGLITAQLLSAALLIAASASAHAQNYPTKPIRVVTSDPGAIDDLTSRMVAQSISARLGQQVVVDNRGGASGAIAANTVASASPDGYTLLSYGSSIWLAPLLQEHSSYDPLRDFTPIAITAKSPVVLVVNNSLPATSVKELIDLAKAKPGSLNYGSGGNGSTPHLSAELFKALAGVDLVRIPYKSTGPALNALVGGQLQLIFATAGSVGPHVKAGRLRALGVASSGPSKLAPNLPTIASTVPGYEFVSNWGWFAPAKTPPAIVQRLSREIAQALSDPTTQERFLNTGIEAYGSTPAQFTAELKLETSTLGKLIQKLGIHAD